MSPLQDAVSDNVTDIQASAAHERAHQALSMMKTFGVFIVVPLSAS